MGFSIILSTFGSFGGDPVVQHLSCAETDYPRYLISQLIPYMMQWITCHEIQTASTIAIASALSLWHVMLTSSIIGITSFSTAEGGGGELEI